jgi:lysophospholipase L1-like esterase
MQPVAAFVVSLLLFLVLLEVTLQIYTRLFIYYDVEMSRYATEIKQKSDNPRIGHEHIPGSSAHLMGVDVEINSDGLRDGEYPVARTDAYRIAVLGDSLTFGWGVPKEASFEALLEEQLNTLRPTEMINFGHGNYNTDQQVSLFKKKGLKYNPDKVVVFYFINDAEVTPVRSKWTPLARLRSVTFLWSRVRGLLSNSSSGATFESFYADLYRDDQPGFEALQQAFLELRDLCLRDGIALQVVLLPELHDLVNYPFAVEYGKVSAFLAQNGIAALDLTPSFAGYENAEALWVAPDDAHPNEMAHKMIADFSLEFIAGDRDEL